MFEKLCGRALTTVAAGALALAASGSTFGAEPAELAKSSGCMTCHDVATKKMGPAFKEVAAKYKGKGDAEKMLVEKVEGAKGHPKVKASESDVKSIIKWVLAM